MAAPQPFPLTKWRRRVLLVLMTNAPHLYGTEIEQATYIAPSQLYPFLAQLEGIGYLTTKGEVSHPSRRYYSLTTAARATLLTMLGKTENDLSTIHKSH